jgi:hypothetical protein
VTAARKVPALRADACPVCGQHAPGRAARVIGYGVLVVLLLAWAGFIGWLLAFLYGQL